MHSMFMSLMVLGIVVGTFVFVGWIVWLGLRQQRERQQDELQLRARMLEKFGNSDEFVGFMQTEAGRKFLETGEKARKSLRFKVASSLSTGVILLLLGGAFFFMSGRVGQPELLFPAAILGALGIGLAISAFIYSRFGRDETQDQ
jgi:RsiW-degrading membrane proteinase PrsW (M82 family)